MLHFLSLNSISNNITSSKRQITFCNVPTMIDASKEILTIPVIRKTSYAIKNSSSLLILNLLSFTTIYVPFFYNYRNRCANPVSQFAVQRTHHLSRIVAQFLMSYIIITNHHKFSLICGNCYQEKIHLCIFYMHIHSNSMYLNVQIFLSHFSMHLPNYI